MHPFGQWSATAGHQVKLSAAIGAAEHGTLNAKHIKCVLSRCASFQQRQGIGASGFRNGRMPDKFNTCTAQFIEQGAGFVA